MPFFSYTAINDKGMKLKGLVEAPSIQNAASVLREKGLFVVHVQVQSKIFRIGLKNQLNRVKFGDVVNFTRQLATMITAGLPLTSGLAILQLQMATTSMGVVIESVLRSVEGGTNFSKALEPFPHVFSSVYIALVKAGESAGIMDQVLTRLADNLEKSREFRGKIVSAMIYPLIILGAMGVVVLIMLVFVLPKMIGIYKDFGASLPLPTLILMYVSDALQKTWIALLFILAGGIYYFIHWSHTKFGKSIVDRLVLSIPFLGPLQKKIALVEFSRTLGVLIGAGVPVIQALSIVKNAMSNVLLEKAVADVSALVQKGSTLSEAIGEFQIFPPIVSRMVAVGEETGKLNEVMLKLSYYYEVEADQALKALTIMLEPLIMIVLGVGVGGLVWAVLSPIWQLTTSIK